MKKTITAVVVIMSLVWMSCSTEKDRYVDLRTGESIKLEKDSETGVWINAETKKPVYMYVDTEKNDNYLWKKRISRQWSYSKVR